MRVMKYLLAVAMCAGLLTSPAQAADAPKADKQVAKDLVLKGDAKCTSCHDEADAPGVLHIGKTRHGVTDGRTPTCTDCHGDSQAHLGYKGSAKPPKPDRYFSKSSETPAADRNSACLSCHKGDKRTHWEGSQHAANDVACTSCHQVHAEQDKVRNKKTQAEVCFTCHKAERAQVHKVSTHPLASGKMACSDCHNPHGSAGPKLLKKNTLNETCYTCHAEKRGPFLFEHRPAVEDCSNCHMPHGANLPPLLKSRPPFMCQECHDGTHASATQVGPNVAGFQGGLSRTSPTGSAINPSANNVGAGCMNCHRQVHGSNSPAGGYLQR